MSRLLEKPNIAMSIKSTGSQLSSTMTTASTTYPADVEDADTSRTQLTPSETSGFATTPATTVTPSVKVTPSK